MDGSEEKAAARWRQCGRLVQAVRAGTQEKKFYDESVKALRAQLRAEFEALLLEDYRYAQVAKLYILAFKFRFAITEFIACIVRCLHCNAFVHVRSDEPIRNEGQTAVNMTEQ